MDSTHNSLSLIFIIDKVGQILTKPYWPKLEGWNLGMTVFLVCVCDRVCGSKGVGKQIWISPEPLKHTSDIVGNHTKQDYNYVR